MEFIIPNIKNPETEAVNCSIVIEIFRNIKGNKFSLFQESVSIPLMQPTNIFKNPKNDDGPLLTSTNEKTLYIPNLVNTESYLEIKITPIKNLVIDDGFMLFTPELPNTLVPSLFLPKYHEVECEMNGLEASCFSYPESNMMIFIVRR